MVKTVGALLAGTLLVAAAAMAFFLLAPRRDDGTTIRTTAGVVLAVRDLARLETASYHMERIIEASDEQSRLFGLLKAKDAVLLVAVGEVTAGVDLAQASVKDVSESGGAKRLRLRLPEPRVFSSAIDNAQTHVYSRTTDALASRKEDLEGVARARAEGEMARAAVEGGLLDRARVNAERTLRALTRSMGWEDVDFEWYQNPPPVPVE